MLKKMDHAGFQQMLRYGGGRPAAAKEETVRRRIVARPWRITYKTSSPTSQQDKIIGNGRRKGYWQTQEYIKPKGFLVYT